MRIVPIGLENVEDFIQYCRKHRDTIDPSFISESELKNYQVNLENPGYLLLADDSEVVGAVSLMLPHYYRELKKGRFRIFHSEIRAYHAYQMLLEAILDQLEGIEDIYFFIFEDSEVLSQIFAKLEFRIQRYSWLMKRAKEEVPQPEFPLGYVTRPLRIGKDEAIWVNFLNICFSKLAGHVDSLPERVAVDMSSESYIEGGMMILWNDNDPVGFVRVARDEECATDYVIEHLGILPEYQGQNLGRNLLRTGIRFGKEQGLNTAWLSVNAENQQASKLYLSEGFEVAQIVTCYNRSLRSEK